MAPTVWISTNKKVTVKLLVDMEKERVVVAESNKDFVDILFSFLTLLMGTIVRLLKKPSELGCLSNLYESVENLDTEHFNTAACKTMLLWPRSEAAARCESLPINIDDTKTREFFTCGICYSSASPVVYSSVANTRCTSCGQTMNRACTWNKEDLGSDGVFVKGGMSFMITDDLHVTEPATKHSVLLIGKLGIDDKNKLEERTLDLGPSEILNLLKRSLISTMPLSDILFGNTDMTVATTNLKRTNEDIIKPLVETEPVKESDSKRISTKLLLDKLNNKVVHAESGEKLTNLLLSFLTFPLGSVIGFLNQSTGMGCIHNLHQSAQDLNIQYFESLHCKSLLLSPKLAPFFGCGNNQLLKIDEVQPFGGAICAFEVPYVPCGVTISSNPCNWRNDSNNSSVKCQHRFRCSLRELNPMIPPNGAKETGRGFVKELGIFVLGDSLGVLPLTPITTIKAVIKSKAPSDKLVEKESSIGEIQALNLLRSALTSQSALTSALFPSGREHKGGNKYKVYEPSSSV